VPDTLDNLITRVEEALLVAAAQGVEELLLPRAAARKAGLLAVVTGLAPWPRAARAMGVALPQP
jgi:hypothetical protein